MSIIGIPRCPHCKKGINVFRIWGLKKDGEYLCPNCKQISNIYHSPLIYIAAFIAIVSSFFIYYFSKIIFENVGLKTVLYVFIPYMGFYILSLFLIYLKKPIVRKINKTTDGRYFDEKGREMKMVMGQLVYVHNQAPKPPVVVPNTEENLVDIYSLNSEINKLKSKTKSLDIGEEEEILKEFHKKEEYKTDEKLDEKTQINFDFKIDDILKSNENTKKED